MTQRLFQTDASLLTLPERISYDDLGKMKELNGDPGSALDVPASIAEDLRDLADQIYALEINRKLPEPLSPEDRFQIGILLHEVPPPTIVTDDGALGL